MAGKGIKKLFQQVIGRALYINAFIISFSSDLSVTPVAWWNWHLSPYRCVAARNRLSRLHRASPSAFLDKWISL